MKKDRGTKKPKGAGAASRATQADQRRKATAELDAETYVGALAELSSDFDRAMSAALAAGDGPTYFAHLLGSRQLAEAFRRLERDGVIRTEPIAAPSEAPPEGTDAS